MAKIKKKVETDSLLEDATALQKIEEKQDTVFPELDELFILYPPTGEEIIQDISDEEEDSEDLEQYPIPEYLLDDED